MTTSPIKATRPATSPLPTPHAGGAPAPAPVTATVAKAAGAADKNLTAAVQRGLQAAAKVNLDGIHIPLNQLDDANDAIATAMEADRLHTRSGDAGLGKAGLVMAGINIALNAKTLVTVLGQHPIPLDRVIGSLVGIGVNLGEFAEKGFMAGLAGVSNAIQGFMGAVDAVKRMKEEGANPSNILEALSYATQALGGVLQTICIACPPLAAALGPVSVGLYMASGALTLAQYAYDHRDWIKDKATKLWGAFSTAVGLKSEAPATPPRAGPRGAPA